MAKKKETKEDEAVKEAVDKVGVREPIQSDHVSGDIPLNAAVYTANEVDALLNSKVAYGTVATAWAQRNSFSAGDYVTRNGTLYKAKVDIPANTAWNASKWQSVTIMAEIPDAISIMDPASAGSTDEGKAADAYRTKQALDGKANVNHAHSTLTSPDSKVTVTATNDGTLTINKPGVPLTDNDTLASLATILGLPDTASLSDVQQALGLPDTATLADAMQAAATPINTRFATIDELPEVPIKAVKQNGTALTPDSNGAVNIEVPEAPVKAVKQNGAALTPDSNGAVNVKGAYYATCDTAQNIANKVAALKNPNETFVLEEGVVVYVKFSYNSWGNMTLNVAGTGAKSVYVGAQQNTSGYTWTSGEVVGFLYDGTYWRMLKHGYATQDFAGLVQITSRLDLGGAGVVQENRVIKNVGTSIAPLWVKNASTSYSAGDYVMYTDGKLYKAKVNIAANTNWNASNWQAVTVEGETKSDKTNLKTILSGMPANLDTYDNALQAINVLWNAVYKLAYGTDRVTSANPGGGGAAVL